VQNQHTISRSDSTERAIDHEDCVFSPTDLETRRHRTNQAVDFKRQRPVRDRRLKLEVVPARWIGELGPPIGLGDRSTREFAIERFFCATPRQVAHRVAMANSRGRRTMGIALKVASLAAMISLSCSVVLQDGVRSSGTECSESRFYYLTDLLAAAAWTGVIASRTVAVLHGLHGAETRLSMRERRLPVAFHRTIRRSAARTT
jgi:hypothetical protein